MKAFLSHSSLDKEFVRAVADNLRRQYCVFDERVFSVGQDFKSSIEAGLSESDVFVLFASKDSLKSVWVDFEINEAWYSVLEKKIRQSLVFIIDTSTEHKDLPPWLQRAKVVRDVSPRIVGREIREHLDNMIYHEQNPIFVGRKDDIDHLQQRLTPPDGSTPPNAVILSGLPGIGRRTLIRHISSSLLSLSRLIVLRIQNGDVVSDIAKKLADQVEPFSTPEGFKRIAEQIDKADNVENLSRIIRDIQICVSNRELPVFFDDGGLLDEDGNFTSPVTSILSILPNYSDTYLFIVSSRRPNQKLPDLLPIVSISPLKIDDIKSLVAALGRRKKLSLSTLEISDLSEYIGGFPPACAYAIQLACDYGIRLVLDNKHRLVEFRRNHFVKYLTDSKLTESEREILRVLAEYSPLPIGVLGESVKLDAEELANTLGRLIDYSLVVPQSFGFYAIADPIKDAVLNVTRMMMAPSEHKSIATSLKRFIESGDVEEYAIDVYRVLFRAATNSGDKSLAADALYFANDVIQLLERSYHARDYEQAIKIGREAVAMRPDNVSVRSFLVRALIQESRWLEAEEEIKQHDLIGPKRNTLFLRGFLRRKKGDLVDAIRFFLEAEAAGNTGSNLKRELAWCYATKGELDKAAPYLKSLLSTHSDDRYIVDLAVQIALKERNEALARERLALLKDVEKESFYQHRVSTVELSFGNVLGALNAANRAIDTEPKPIFAMVGQLAWCELRSGNVQKAEELLGRLEKAPKKRLEYIVSLKAEIELEKKHFSNAIQVLDSYPNKGDKFYKHLRGRALDGELKHGSVAEIKRAKYEQELHRINMEATNRSSPFVDELMEIVE